VLRVKVLVTGGAGFIGSHLADRLVADGHEVLVVDNLSTGHREFVPSAAELVECDICSDELPAITHGFGPELVYHLAAQISVSESTKDPRRDAEINITGGLNVLQAAADSVVRRLVFASTGAIYSVHDALPFTETSRKDPLAPYGIAKLALELYCHHFACFKGLETVSLRLGNVYGPRQNPLGEAGVIAIFLNRMLSGEPVQIHGTGAQAKDYVYVGDVVDAFAHAANCPLEPCGESDDRAFNIATNQPRSVNEIFTLLSTLTGSTHPPVNTEPRPADQKLVHLDWSKAHESMGWSPQVVWEDGLARTKDWFATNAAMFRD
jgi:UDP-glucose 4-epimerase